MSCSGRSLNSIFGKSICIPLITGKTMSLMYYKVSVHSTSHFLHIGILNMQKKLLLVEDDAEVGSFIRRGLSEAGYEVTVAFDGLSGLKLATSGTYDLIILDLMLP